MFLVVDQRLQEAATALDRAEPVGLPGPLPLPYVVAARTAQTVNEIKERPLDQPVTLIVENLNALIPFLDLNFRALSLASQLSSTHLIHLQLPAKDGLPSWAKGGLSKACWASA